MERWKLIDQSPGYEVSDLGRIRNSSTKRIRKLSQDYKGYWGFTPSRGTRFKVHRLVAIAFLGKSDLQVNHKDGDKSHNWVGNLEYLTNAENAQHAYREGICRRTLNAEQVVEIRRRLYEADLSTGKIFQDLANEFGVGRTTISMIAHRRIWGHLSDGFPPIQGQRGNRRKTFA